MNNTLNNTLLNTPKCTPIPQNALKLSRKVDECRPLIEGLAKHMEPGDIIIDGRGLHSSTIRLNVSTFLGIRWVHGFPTVY